MAEEPKKKASFGKLWPVYVTGKPIIVEVRTDRDCAIDVFVNQSRPIRTYCEKGERQALIEVCNLRHLLVHARDKK